MDELLSGLRAAAEATRVRILFLLSHGEANVSELTQILGQSQPRVSRHLKLMAEAGLDQPPQGRQLGAVPPARGGHGRRPLPRHRRPAARRRPGAGGRPGPARGHPQPPGRSRLALFRATMPPAGNSSARSMCARRMWSRPWCGWPGQQPIRLHVDLGTGTGAVLRRFAARAQQSIGIDSSRDMLAIAGSTSRRRASAMPRCAMARSMPCPFPTASPISSPSTRCCTSSTTRPARWPRPPASSSPTAAC